MLIESRIFCLPVFWEDGITVVDLGEMGRTGFSLAPPPPRIQGRPWLFHVSTVMNTLMLMSNNQLLY